MLTSDGYIDDLLFIWRGGVSTVPELSKYLNTNLFDLVFIFSSQGQEVNFLDLNLKGEYDQIIKSSTFRKATAGNTILHFYSFHPKHTLKSNPVGELTRAKCNCPSELELAMEEDMICNRLTTK